MTDNPSAASTDARTWSWKRAMGVAAGMALAVAALAFLVGVNLAPPGTDMAKMGEGTGRLISFVFLIGFAGSYLWQTGRKTPAYIAFGSGTVLGLLPVVLPLVVPGPPRVLEPAERGIFEYAEDRSWRQFEVGLQVPPLPSRFEVTTLPDPGRDVANWLWSASDGERASELVVVVIASPQKEAAKELPRFIGGVTSGMLARGLEADADFTVTEQPPDRISGSLRGVPFSGRGVAYTKGERHYMALILVVSGDGELRRRVVEGFGPISR